MSAQIGFTALNGSRLWIDGTSIYKIRASLPFESPVARSRIDWAIQSLVTEPLDVVVPLVQAVLPSLTALTSLDDAKIWFDAKQAVGPLPVLPRDLEAGFNSSLKIRGIMQYVVESPLEVTRVLAAAIARAEIPSA